MAKIYSFLGLILTSFLTIGVIQFTAISDFALAAGLSRFFAIATIIFSFLYLGQRQFINIHGHVVSEQDDFLFRGVNVLLSSIICILAFEVVGAGVELAILIIGFKVSEAIVDYLFGFLNYKYGFAKGSFLFFKSSILRVSIILLFLIMGLAIYDFDLQSSVSLSAPIILAYSIVYFFVSLKQLSKQPWSFDYKKTVVTLLPYSISASVCAFLLLSPRWLVSPDTPGGEEFLVAFSLVPVFGVALNTLFASYIGLARIDVKKAYLKLLITASILCLLLFLSTPIQAYIYSIVYGLNEVEANTFARAVNVGCLFFSAVLFANFFKFKQPIYEAYCYLLGISMLYLITFLGGGNIMAIVVSSLSILLFSTLSLKVRNETYHIS
ncbi:hypothetical protein [Pleionea mediterranea]|uniref:Uncharacterized protein n=1 Tax=Pleionea mediterranea TaxID=523701 RepID=A0A316G8S6_9GAMM|nr:hypothetical protein [Pleionea mediterranea]PWK50877.1 hypothetical protein C8D97_106168 [Pleionea mediterranea]